MVIGQRPLNASTQHREDTTKVPIKSRQTNGIKCCSVKTRKFFNDKFLVSQWSVPAVHAADYTNHLHLISLSIVFHHHHVFFVTNWVIFSVTYLFYRQTTMMFAPDTLDTLRSWTYTNSIGRVRNCQLAFVFYPYRTAFHSWDILRHLFRFPTAYGFLVDLQRTKKK